MFVHRFLFVCFVFKSSARECIIIQEQLLTTHIWGGHSKVTESEFLAMELKTCILVMLLDDSETIKSKDHKFRGTISFSILLLLIAPSN